MLNAPTWSCRLELLPGTGPVEKIRHAKAFGFDAVALPGRYLSDYIDELRACAGDLSLLLSALSLGFVGSLVSPSAARRRECRDSLVALFDLCAELGISHFNMPPVLIEDNPERSADAAEQDAWLLESLPGLADEAGRRGVTLLLEPVNRYESDYMNTLGHAVSICERVGSDDLGVTADLFHMQMEELSVPESIEAAGRWLKYAHVAENNRQEPGIGSMDFAAAFAALREIGYDGVVEVESRSLSGVAEEVLPLSAAFLRRTWEKAESVPVAS